ncbi:MAG: GDSL-type esterase/lipase family protein, partial [Planctomycetota bacterium]|nr:GDSL-type esterase/lipase family protein [Planctomycetota bacterium]
NPSSRNPMRLMLDLFAISFRLPTAAALAFLRVPSVNGALFGVALFGLVAWFTFGFVTVGVSTGAVLNLAFGLLALLWLRREENWRTMRRALLEGVPNWLTIKIGINDLHRNLANAADLSPSAYEGLYTEILDLTQKHTKARIVLIDPFYISTDTETGSHRSTVLERLPAYRKVVAKLAKKYNVAGHVKTHALYQKQLKYRPADRFCPEPVHPNAAGHTVIALGLLEALGW